MEDTVKIKLFTWNGKDYIIDVNPEQYKKLIESGKYTEEDLNREFVKNLHRVRDKEGNLLYPEMTPRPSPDKQVESDWFKERLKLGMKASKGELSPHAQAVKEWETNFPLAKQFYDEMSRYSIGSGATYGALRGDNFKAYKAFSNLYPGVAMTGELTGGLVTGGIASIGARKALAFLLGNKAALTPMAGYGQKIWKGTKDIAGSTAEGLAHMFAWRYGHDLNDPFTTERFLNSIKGPNAFKDYGIAAAFGAAFPMAGRAYVGIKDLSNHLKRRGGPDSMAITAIAEDMIDAMPLYLEHGINEDMIWSMIGQQMSREGKPLIDAFTMTRDSLNKFIQGEAPQIVFAPFLRSYGQATSKSPDRAFFAQTGRQQLLDEQMPRVEKTLLDIVGGVQSPKVTLDRLQANLKDQYKHLYAAMEGSALNRDVFRHLIKKEGKWEARHGKDRNYIDRAWDDTIEELRGGNEGTLPTREEFLRNRYQVPTSESKKLIDSGEYYRVRDTSGKLLNRVKIVDSDGKVRYEHILAKHNNTILPLHAQYIEQNAYKYAKFQDPRNSTSPAPDKRVQDRIMREVNEWNEAIYNAIPAYRAASHKYNQSRLNIEAYKSGLSFPQHYGGEGYKRFEEWYEANQSLFPQFSNEHLQNAKNMFYGGVVKSYGVTPRELLRGENKKEIQERLARIIGNEDDFKRFMLFNLDELGEETLTGYLPHSGIGQGKTVTQLAKEPSLMGSLPHDIPMAMFSLPFFLGRKGGSISAHLRGLETAKTQDAIVKLLTARGQAQKEDTVSDLYQEISRLRSEKPTGSGITHLNPFISQYYFEGGQPYAMQKRKDRTPF